MNNSEPNPNHEDDAVITIPSTFDISQALTDRYAKSKAPQHRHLIATAAAMKSILLEENLPLTPPAFFAAAITAFADHSSFDSADPDSIAAISAFLAILLSVDSMEVPKAKAREAAVLVAEFLKSESGTATGSVRCLIKALGGLVVRVDLEDWDAVEMGVRTLLLFAVDKRPKVRKCAQICVEKFFKTLKSHTVQKNASKVVFDMYKKYMQMTEKLNSSIHHTNKVASKPEHLEMLHMLNVLTVILPNLSSEVRMKILSVSYKLLGCSFSSHSRHFLKLLEALVEYSDVEDLTTESENFFSVITSFISTKQNPVDTVISASTLLKDGLKKLNAAQPSLWIRFLPPIFTSLVGHLNSDANTSKHVEDVLKELITTHVNQNDLLNVTSQSCLYEKDDNPEVFAITAICTVLVKMLAASKIPTKSMLVVISVLFLTLGEYSYYFMTEILLKLSQKAMGWKEEFPNMEHLEACIGASIVAMGPEKVLSVIPISLDTEKLTCLNMWMLPILKKYVIGASLEYYMDHIAPLAKTLQESSTGVKKASRLENLNSSFQGLWDLLPAFCRYPTDAFKSFKALSRLLVATFEESPSLHETIAKAVQVLVNGTRNLLNTNQETEPFDYLSSSYTAEDFIVEAARNLVSQNSKHVASKNWKTMTSSSKGLFHTLTDIFLDSTQEKRSSLKEAINCLAYALGSKKIKHFFVSSLKKCDPVDGLMKTSKQEVQVLQDDTNEGKEETTENDECGKKRCLIMEMASSFVGVADEDLANMIFSFIKSCLLTTDGVCQSEAYYTLSRILEEHSWFCSARMDDLMDLLFSVKIHVDSTALSNRFLCFHYLLAYILKRNDEDMDTKAFLILNEIIVTLKTKKESRKLAYNILLKISCTLKDTQSADPESGLQRLLNMVMGYLSSSSPHIISGAISALALLVHNDGGFCIAVPNLIPSVLTLLENKDIEIIKAALGFIKVIVSSLHSKELIVLLSDILNGVLPWSSVSKHHFRSKVGIILEILIRKCGSDAVGLFVPEKYKNFFRTTDEGRKKKRASDGHSSLDTELELADDEKQGGQKRSLEDSKVAPDNTQKWKKRKRQDYISTNEQKTSHRGDKATRSQAAKGVIPSVSHSPLKTQSRGVEKKWTKHVLQRLDRKNKRLKIESEKDDSTKKYHNSSSLTSKSNKHGRKSRNPRPHQ